MDANGMRTTVHNILGADDALVITTIEATVGEATLVVKVGDRGPHASDDRFEVAISRDGEAEPIATAGGPDEAAAVRSAWSKARTHLG